MIRGLLMLLNFTGVPRLVTRLLLDRRMPLRLKLILPATLIYLVAPFDIVPDMFPVLGRIDDVLVILIALALFLGMAPRDLVMEHMRSIRPNSKPENPRTRPGQTVIDGSYRIVEDGDESNR